MDLLQYAGRALGWLAGMTEEVRTTYSDTFGGVGTVVDKKFVLGHAPSMARMAAPDAPSFDRHETYIEVGSHRFTLVGAAPFRTLQEGDRVPVRYRLVTRRILDYVGLDMASKQEVDRDVLAELVDFSFESSGQQN